MSWRSIGWGVLFGSVLGVLAGAAGAGENPPQPGLSPQARRERLLPVYRQVAATPALAALEPRFEPGRGFDPRAVAAYVAAMPLSPRDWLRLDMFVRRYEMALPGYVEDWHTAWIKAHEKEARALYGDRHVKARLTPPISVPWFRLAGAGILIPINRNLGADGVPAPEGYQGETQVAANPTNAALPTCLGAIHGSDPALHWNDQGEVFLNYMLVCGNAVSRSTIVVAKSTDDGATWAAQGVVAEGWTSVVT